MNRIRFGVLLLSAWLVAPAQNFKDLEKEVTAFTLPNGMRFVVAARHDCPVIAFRTYVGVGSVNDPAGASGLAQIFERIAFKGTETIGTRDGAGEKRALEAVEEAYDRMEAERNKGARAGELKILSLRLELQKALDLARSFETGSEFLHALDAGGVTGLAAVVTQDSTQFQAIVPSNRAELWFLMESQRYLRPVFRDFYRERDRAVEDYRNRVELNPRAKLLESLAASAFSAHPYHNPPAGWPSDLAELRQADAQQFFNRYYVPANITVAISGDIGAEDARRLAERYFGPIPARPMPPAVHTAEPPQTGARTVLLEVATQPLLAIGYKRPDMYDRESAALDILATILGTGRAAWLTKDLVDQKRIANSVQAHATFPGERYPNLFTFLVAVAPGHTAEENDHALTAVLTRLQNGKVDDSTLERAKAQARAAILRRLSDNPGIATTLATVTAERGDWRQVFATLDELSKVTADQVQIAALKYFVPARRTAAYMVPPPPAMAPPGGNE